jgi:hypothetical protein
LAKALWQRQKQKAEIWRKYSWFFTPSAKYLSLCSRK